MRYVSPLRYPGGKAALTGFLAQTIELNSLSGCLYFEPFAGGAGAALRLLLEGVVSELHLNDRDPRIAAFWNAALNESERFIEAILTVPVNTMEWHKQREICYNPALSKPFELGFATFYLNRCNRSGVIIGAAPIGGYAQKGHWKIGTRFYRKQLAKRIRVLASRRDQIHVTGMDAKDFLVEHLPRSRRREGLFVYLDPPYYSKGSRLYMNAYEDQDHRRLADYMQRQSDLRWVASYDDTDFIRELYTSCNISDNLLQYSLQGKRLAKEILIAPPHVRIPGSIGPRKSMVVSS